MATATNTTTAPTATASATKPPSKSAAVTKLLSRGRGATVAEMQDATGWQPHTVRAYLSGLRKAGRTLDKEERKSGETGYRLVAAVPTVEPLAKVDPAPKLSVALPADNEVGAHAKASA